MPLTAARNRHVWLAWLGGGVLMALPFLWDVLEPLGLASLVPWLWACERDDERPFLKGYVGGFVFVFAGLSWLHHVTPVAVAITAAYFALYPAVFAVIMVRTRLRFGWPTWATAPLAVATSEILAQHVSLLPVTWLFQGYSSWRWRSLVQVAEWGGITLVSATCALVAGLVLALGSAMARHGIHGLRRREAWLPLAVTAVVVGCFTAYGTMRLASLGLQPGPRVGLVQGNVPQVERLNPANAYRIVDLHARLSVERARGVDLVAWPESTVNFPVEARPDVREKLAACARDTGAWLLLGAHGMNEFPPPSNSAFLFDPRGRLVERSDKRILVPGAETLLLLDHVELVRKPLIESLGRTMGFRPYLRAGDRAVVLAAGPWRFGSLICYDDVVPMPSDELRSAGVDALITISNEAWFGKREMDQHLAMATVQCILTRMPMGRSTNTGLTCTIDPGGRVLEILPRDEPGVLVGMLPVTRTWVVPPWVRAGFQVLAALAGLAVLAATFRRSRS